MFLSENQQPDAEIVSPTLCTAKSSNSFILSCHGASDDGDDGNGVDDGSWETVKHILQSLNEPADCKNRGIALLLLQVAEPSTSVKMEGRRRLPFPHRIYVRTALIIIIPLFLRWWLVINFNEVNLRQTDFV